MGTDDEMEPRVQLGSVPWAVQALTVPDGSITTEKIADGAVTQAKLGPDVNLEPPDGSITTAKLADGAVTTAKIADGAVTQAKLSPDVRVEPPDGSITTVKLANGAVTSVKIANGAVTQVHAPSLIASGTGSNVKVYFGQERITASSSTGMLSKTILLPTPCPANSRVKVWVQPVFNQRPSINATIGSPWDNTKFTVFLAGNTWSAGQVQDFLWLAICEG